jgi:5-deoxy-D-glucuronate isomerase
MEGRKTNCNLIMYVRVYNSEENLLGWFPMKHDTQETLPQIVVYGKYAYALCPATGLIQNPCYKSLGKIEYSYTLYTELNNQKAETSKP